MSHVALATDVLVEHMVWVPPLSCQCAGLIFVAKWMRVCTMFASLIGRFGSSAYDLDFATVSLDVKRMCGRVAQNYTWREIVALYQLTQPTLNLQPRYNIAPTTTIDAVIPRDGARLELVRMRRGRCRRADIAQFIQMFRFERARLPPAPALGYRTDGLEDCQ